MTPNQAWFVLGISCVVSGVLAIISEIDGYETSGKLYRFCVVYFLCSLAFILFYAVGTILKGS